MKVRLGQVKARSGHLRTRTVQDCTCYGHVMSRSAHVRIGCVRNG